MRPFVFMLPVILASAACWPDGSELPSPVLRGGLQAIDWLVVGVYMIGMLVIGLYYHYRTKTADEYYLGGRRMKPFMVGISLFATLISTISYLAVPGEVIRHGPMFILYVAAVPFIFAIVGYLIIPFIMRLPITSAYEILDARFGPGVRLFGSSMFLVIRFMWMGLVVFSAAKVVIPCVGWPTDKLPYVLVVVGASTVAYAALGGLRAVVLTDVIQAFILFGGALLCVGIVTVKMGGLGWIPTQWSPNWDVQPWFSFDPHVRLTVFATLMHTTTWWICTAGSDQMAIQRYLATRDDKAARRAFLINNLADASVQVLLMLLGFALLAFYLAHPEYQVGRVNIAQDADYLFPHFIVNFVGYGMGGLVISGMLAAAMSSLSSGVTSTATVINTDILPRFLKAELSDRDRVRLGKGMTVVVGIIVIGLGLLMDQVPGNLYEVTTKTNGLFVAPLFGLFLMAMCVPFATPLGAVLGSLYALLAAFLIAFWDVTGARPLSFQWIMPVSLLVNVAAGCLISLLLGRCKSPQMKTALRIVCAAPLPVIAAWFIAACTNHPVP